MNSDLKSGNPTASAARLGFRIRLRASLGLLCVCVLLALAAAGPPDALWISGIYDGGDSDDLVAISADGDLSLCPIAVPTRESRGLVFPAAEPGRTLVVTVRPLRPRAPPFA